MPAAKQLELPQAEQLELRPATVGEWQQRWVRIRRAVRDAVDAIGVKQVAFDLDIAPSQLINALEERDRHYLRLEWLVYIVAKAPIPQDGRSDDLVRLLADIQGRDVEPKKVMTPEQELAVWKAATKAAMAPALYAVVAAEAQRMGGK